MEIKNEQIIALQTALSKRHETRESRLNFLSWFLETEITSVKDLSTYEATDVLYFLKTGVKDNNKSWGYFNHKSKPHRKVVSVLYELEWVTEVNGRTVPDVARLGKWLKSMRSPVKKPLLKMYPVEVNKIINALEGMLSKKYAAARS